MPVGRSSIVTGVIHRGILSITLVSGLLAVMIGVLHASIGPAISLGGVHPSLLVAGVVTLAAVTDRQSAVLAAFTAGLVANLLVREPLGSLPLAMLLVAGLTIALGGPLGRVSWLHPIAAGFAGSLVADGTALTVHALLGDPLEVGIPVGVTLVAATINAALALIGWLVARRLTGSAEAVGIGL